MDGDKQQLFSRSKSVEKRASPSPGHYGAVGDNCTNPRYTNNRGAGKSNDGTVSESNDGPHGIQNSEEVTVKTVCGLSERQVFRARLWSALVLTFYMAASMGSSPLTSQYVYLRLMPQYINMSDNSTVDTNPCTANDSDPRVKAQDNLQAAASAVFLYISLASTVPTILVVTVLGCYSDVIGRKVLFFLPTVGGLLKMVFTAILIKVELDLAWLYVINVLEGFTGSFAAVLLATFAYTADLTRPARSRTLAIAILESCLALAGAASDIGVGYLIEYVDYFYATFLVIFMMLVAVLLIFTLPETVRKDTLSSVATAGASSGTQAPSRNPFKYVKNIFAFYFTAGTLRRRTQFILAMLIFFLVVFSFIGRNGTDVLFEMNSPFCWGSVTIGIYGGVNVVVRAFGSVLSVHVLQYCLSDTAIVAVTVLTGAFSDILYGFATSSAWLYASVPVGAISNAAIPVSRAILSKMAGASRQGALFASIAVMETLCSLASSSFFNAVYLATVADKPGAVYLCVAGIIVIPFVLILVFKYISAGHSLVCEDDQPLPSPVLHSEPTSTASNGKHDSMNRSA